MKFLLMFSLLCGSVFAADTTAAPDFTVKQLGNGVYAAVTRDGGKSGSNAGFIVGDVGCWSSMLSSIQRRRSNSWRRFAK